MGSKCNRSSDLLTYVTYKCPSLNCLHLHSYYYATMDIDTYFIQQRINCSYKRLHLLPLILMMYVISMVFSVYSLNFKRKVLKFLLLEK